MDGRLPSEILTVSPEHYMYGDSILRIHVIRTCGVVQRDGHIWIQVEGMEYDWRGHPAGQRTAYIRADLLPTGC